MRNTLPCEVCGFSITNWRHIMDGCDDDAHEYIPTRSLQMLTDKDIEDRVTYHTPTPRALEMHAMVRGTVQNAMHETELLPPGREQSLAITKLEEYMFWATAAIARNHDKL